MNLRQKYMKFAEIPNKFQARGPRRQALAPELYGLASQLVYFCSFENE